MIATILRKEMTELFRDGRFRWAGGVVAALLVASLLVGWKHHLEVQAQHETARRAERELWLNKGEMNPHGAAHYGAYAFKPRMPLAAVDRGLDPYVGVASYLEAHKQNPWKFKPAEDSTEVQRLGELTAAATLQVLVPLLIILLGFSAVAGERETGTLRQLLALGVPRRSLVLGKILGTAVPLALLLVPATLVGILAIALNRGSAALLASGSRLALMATAYLLYFAVWLAISLAVSARASSSRLALVALIGLWFVTTLVAPRIVSDLARRAHPAPTAVELAAAIEADKKKLPEWDARVAAIEFRLLKQYGVATTAELPVNPQGVALEEGEADDTAVYERNLGALMEHYERQNRFYQAGAAVSPLIAIQTLSMGLAGTDFAQHRHFSDAAEAYRRKLISTMNNDVTVHQKLDDYDYKGGRSLWEKVPPFAYTAPGAGWVLTKTSLASLFLGLWLAAAAVLAPLAFTGIRP